MRIGGLVALLGVAGIMTGAPALAQNKKITINQSAQSLSAAAVYLAKDGGFFAKEGLDVEFVATGSGLKSIVPLLSGDTQFCACVFSHNISANETGAGDIKLIASVVDGYAQKMALDKATAQRLNISASTPMKERMAALKGLKIGISEPNSAADQVARLMLKEGGLNGSRDAQLISLGVPNLNAALHNKQIDAFVITAPNPELAVREGDAVMLVDLSKDKIANLSEATYIGLSADKKYLAANKSTALKVVRALAGAQVMLQSKTAEAKKLLRDKEFPKMEQEVFDLSFESAFPFYAKTPEIFKERVDAALAIAQAFSKTRLKVTYDDLVDPSVAQAIAGH